MMSVSRVNLAWKALQELGLGQVLNYAWYWVLLHSGYLRWVTKDGGSAQRLAGGRISKVSASSSVVSPPSSVLRPILNTPPRDLLSEVLGKDGYAALLAEADEILAGQVRLFGGAPVSLRVGPGGPLAHWTEYEQGKVDTGTGEAGDIKLVWEPARFGWAYTLGRAYLLSGDERYPHGFWDYALTFLEANPPYSGPQWVSAQEVALRLIALVLASQEFAASEHSTAERMERLSEAVAAHARRILPGMAYARAQNNNHLLSEAAGLYTAGLALPDHPESGRWRDLGWRWFHWGLQRQIAPDGTYVQHSTNYHRLMLQLGLWVYSLASEQDQAFPASSLERLSSATRWLLELTDMKSGGVPNLGPNDGAYIFPFTICPFQDHRPVLQTAGLAFLGQQPFPAGAWDEMAMWLGYEKKGSGDKGQGIEELYRGTVPLSPISASSSPLLPTSPASHSPHILRITPHESWAYLRIARFHSRPGHADQLHLDLWWRGLNLALDPGAYLYNALPPWDNSLARTCVHNTLAIDRHDQMTRASRFLWLDRAQAEVVARERAEDGAWERLTARHDGYRRLGLSHQRSVTAFRQGRWLVEDQVVKVGSSSVDPTFNLHWLMPDWPWEISEIGDSRVEMRLVSTFGPISIHIGTSADLSFSPLPSPITRIQLVRAGELIFGSGEVQPFMGWSAPTYANKIPVLSLTVTATSKPPFTITTEWILPNASSHAI